MKWGVWTYDLPLDRCRIFGEEQADRRNGVMVSVRDGSGSWWLEIGPVSVFDGPQVEDLAWWGAVWAENWARELPLSRIRTSLLEAACPNPVLGTLSGTWLLGMMAKRAYGRGFRRRVWLTALLELADDREQDIRGRVERMARAGYRYVKVKVREADPDTAVEAIRAIRLILGPRCQVRVDVNASWPREAVEFLACRALLPEPGMAPVMYLEDPFSGNQAGEEFPWPVPLALDTWTCLRHGIPRETGWKGPLRWGVWKPFVSWSIRQRMAERDWSVTVSSACESGVGVAALAVLSLEGNLARGVGLGSYRWLSEDVLKARLPIVDQPWVELRDLLWASQRVMTGRLTLRYDG